MPKRHDELMLDRAEGFVKRERLLQRLGAGLMCLFVLAGAAGLFGQGVLSHRDSTSGNLTVVYERFSRLLLRNTVAIAARVPGPDGQTVRISLDKAFLDRVAIQEMRPSQLEMSMHEDRVHFLVPVTAGLARLELHIKPERPGSLTASIRLEGTASDAIDLRQFVFF